MFVTCSRPQQLPLSYLPLPQLFSTFFSSFKVTPIQKYLPRAYTILVHCGRPERTIPAYTLLWSLCIYVFIFKPSPPKPHSLPPLCPLTLAWRGTLNCANLCTCECDLFVTSGYLAKVTMRNEFLTKEGLSPLRLVSLRREDRWQWHVEKQTQEGGHKTRTHRLERRS